MLLSSRDPVQSPPRETPNKRYPILDNELKKGITEASLVSITQRPQKLVKNRHVLPNLSYAWRTINLISNLIKMLDGLETNSCKAFLNSYSG